MYIIANVNGERLEFLKKMCEVLKYQITGMPKLISILDRDSKIVELTYEEFVGRHFERGMIPCSIGQMRVIDGVKEVLVPTKEGAKWYPHDCFDADVKLEQVVKNTTLEYIYGLPTPSKGYFTTKDRVVLYDHTWKKVRLTRAQIAEKFGIKLEQLEIVG